MTTKTLEIQTTFISLEMSWISDLADRAENILNKIDQNAATVLKQTTPARREEEEYFIAPNQDVEIAKPILSRKYLHSPEKRTIEVESETSILSTPKISDYSSEDNEEVKPKTINDVTTNTELIAFKIALADIKAERDELKQEVSELQENLKTAKGETLINELRMTVETLNLENNQMKAKLDEVTCAKNDCLKSMSELEFNLSQKKQELFDLNEKLVNQTKEAEQKTADLEKYRKKAQSTLQTKDKIIEELRQGNLSRLEVLEPDQSNLQQIELENLKHDILIKKNQILELQQESEESNNILENLQKELKHKDTELESIRGVLMNNLKMEQEKSVNLEAEMKLLNHEISAIRQETHMQRQLHMAQLHEKEQQINKMRKGNADYQALGDSNNVEARLQSLTQALFQKQTSLENITSEKNALKLQLERVEGQMHHLMNQSRHSSSQVVHLNDTDDAKAQFPIMMRETPFDTRVTRRVKRAYSTLDSAGIRVGVFLRRYPLIRIGVLIYIALVHLWVIFVLLSSTPS